MDVVDNSSDSSQRFFSLSIFQGDECHGHPDAVRVELQQSGGIGATGRDWGLKALHPLLLLSVGNRRQLCQHFWLTAPSRSGKRRFFGEPGLQGGEELQKMLQEAWICSVPCMARSSSGGSSRAPSPCQELWKGP
ncbi:hypothetical protein DV515_00007427 [Chloebia gouldiae]|uniref:Uncharacterized protein n=1 Tax=Chloebia gouldiae TaxID=44316 RepID=A0A3L8SHE9_CHLGU|nr:hypothetical protein DV515_00007427 [Chloebia gouldiae]